MDSYTGEDERGARPIFIPAPPGTPDDIIQRLKDLESVGLEYIALHPAGPDFTQLDLRVKHLFPAFTRK